MNTDRFACASSTLSLVRLLKQGRKVLFLGLGLAVGIHFSLTRIRGMQEEEKVTKPLTTKFVKRQPRLTKPLEMKKRPRPKRRRLQRKMVAVKARTEQISPISSIQPVGIIGSLSRPNIQVSRLAGLQHQAFEPQITARAIEGTKESEQMVDMSLEMVDVNALDTGRYHAMVLQDPVHKRDIKGYFHMARIFPHTAAADQARVNRHPFALPRMLPNLVQAMNKFTDIRTDIAGTYSFDSKEFAKTPIVFVCTHVVFRLTDSEALNLGNYLLNGGFLYTDTLHTNAEINHESIRNIWIDGLIKVGLPFERDWYFEKLPSNHPLYTCYFDFEGPPPCHSSLWKARGNMPLDVPDYLTGVTIDGRLLGIMTKRNYSAPWDHWLTHYKMDNTRQLQFGVNITIFALTQEGSITNRIMDTVRY